MPSLIEFRALYTSAHVFGTLSLRLYASGPLGAIELLGSYLGPEIGPEGWEWDLEALSVRSTAPRCDGCRCAEPSPGVLRWPSGFEAPGRLLPVEFPEGMGLTCSSCEEPPAW